MPLKASLEDDAMKDRAVKNLRLTLIQGLTLIS